MGTVVGFSALQRAEIAETAARRPQTRAATVSVLFNEPKLLKAVAASVAAVMATVSVLFNEPKLLKHQKNYRRGEYDSRFSALQRAEIAETPRARRCRSPYRVSVLFNEPKLLKSDAPNDDGALR